MYKQYENGKNDRDFFKTGILLVWKKRMFRAFESFFRYRRRRGRGRRRGRRRRRRPHTPPPGRNRSFVFVRVYVCTRAFVRAPCAWLVLCVRLVFSVAIR